MVHSTTSTGCVRQCCGHNLCPVSRDVSSRLSTSPFVCLTHRGRVVPKWSNVLSMQYGPSAQTTTVSFAMREGLVGHKSPRNSRKNNATTSLLCTPAKRTRAETWNSQQLSISWPSSGFSSVRAMSRRLAMTNNKQPAPTNNADEINPEQGVHQLLGL